MNYLSNLFRLLMVVGLLALTAFQTARENPAEAECYMIREMKNGVVMNEFGRDDKMEIQRLMVYNDEGELDLGITGERDENGNLVKMMAKKTDGTTIGIHEMTWDEKGRMLSRKMSAMNPESGELRLVRENVYTNSDESVLPLVEIHHYVYQEGEKKLDKHTKITYTDENGSSDSKVYDAENNLVYTEVWERSAKLSPFGHTSLYPYQDKNLITAWKRVMPDGTVSEDSYTQEVSSTNEHGYPLSMVKKTQGGEETAYTYEYSCVSP